MKFTGSFFIVGDTAEQIVDSLEEIADQIRLHGLPTNAYGGSTEHGGEWDFDIVENNDLGVFEAREAYVKRLAMDSER